ncbi:aminoglycoside phosphotransferase family protein [Pontibaca salina]|uniref:Phosphotransferase n=1 Tax=Pontibaca salina TaxID=2795731 RepID=A0A934HPR3_9RHOB|nr:phosphotransferase [Pontibaca salina]MBI6629477.1 phosphotransferase [Pontibaca salina]
MSEREELIAGFLAGTRWAKAQREPLAGDASSRRYERLNDPQTGATAVLMDAPPDQGEDVRPFVRIANHLRDLGLSAPEILAEDTENGFLLLEDLGDDLFARLLNTTPKQENDLYRAATDVLIALHNTDPPELKTYTPPIMAEMTDLAFTHYRAAIWGRSEPQLQERFQQRFTDILSQSVQSEPVLVLRDYHAENLLWLPKRDGIARVGLLDFQDAVLGHPAYDLVSLLQDVRRDVSVAVEQVMLTHYIKQTDADDHRFRRAYAVLGVQRNLRILGVFARLARERNKPYYLTLMPRVWEHLTRGLDHPALAPVAELLTRELPPPTPENLDRLKTA